MTDNTQKPVYKRLGGRGLTGCLPGLRGASTLWITDDHLLQATRLWMVERYRRFYLADIQAFVLRRTRRGAVVSLVAAGAAILCLAAGIVRGGESLVGFGLSAAILAILATVNASLGPTCVTQLRTAVQTETLRSLNRLRSTRRILARLQPLIEAAQADLAPRHPVEQIQAAAGMPVPAHAGVAPEQQRTPSYRGRWHFLLFAGFTVDSAVTAGMIFANHVLLWIAGALLTVSLAGLVIVALVRQHRTGCGSAVTTITWLALAYLGASMLAGQVLNVVVSVANPQASQNQWLLLKNLADLDISGSRWLLGLISVFAVVSFVLGCAGLALSAAEWRKRPEASPAAGSASGP